MKRWMIVGLVALVYFGFGYFIIGPLKWMSIIGLFLFAGYLRRSRGVLTKIPWTATILSMIALFLGARLGIWDSEPTRIQVTSWHTTFEEPAAGSDGKLRRLTFEAAIENYDDSKAVRIRRVSPVFSSTFSSRVSSGDTSMPLQSVVSPQNTLTISGSVWIRTEGLSSSDVAGIQRFDIEYETKRLGWLWWRSGTGGF